MLFFFKSFFLPHAPLSIHAGREISPRGFSCIRTSKENRNFRWVTPNFRGYLLFDDFEFLIIMFTHHLLLTSFPFTIVWIGRQDNDRLLAPSLHNGSPEELVIAYLLLPYHQFFFPCRWYIILVDTLSLTTSKIL